MTFKDILRQRAKKTSSTKVLGKINVYDVILSPLFTEKTYKLSSDSNKYSFKVHKDANKNDVKNAVKYVFNVDAQKVNIINVTYKSRNGVRLVRKAHKKAIITLEKGKSIDLTA